MRKITHVERDLISQQVQSHWYDKNVKWAISQAVSYTFQYLQENKFKVLTDKPKEKVDV